MGTDSPQTVQTEVTGTDVAGSGGVVDALKDVGDILADVQPEGVTEDDSASADGSSGAVSGEAPQEPAALADSPDGSEVEELPTNAAGGTPDRLASALMGEVDDLPATPATNQTAATQTQTTPAAQAAAPKAGDAPPGAGTLPENFEAGIADAISKAAEAFGADEPEAKALATVGNAVKDMAAIIREQQKKLDAIDGMRKQADEAVENARKTQYYQAFRTVVDSIGGDAAKYFGRSDKPLTEKTVKNLTSLHNEAAAIQAKAAKVGEQLSAEEAVHIAAHRLMGKITTPKAMSEFIGGLRKRSVQRTPAANGKPARVVSAPRQQKAGADVMSDAAAYAASVFKQVKE